MWETLTSLVSLNRCPKSSNYSSASTFIALASQVSGHAGVQTTANGSLIIKPVRHYELQFFQPLQPDSTPAVLFPFTPKSFGTLRLENTVHPDLILGVIVQSVADSKGMYMVLSFSSINLELMCWVFTGHSV